MRDAGRTDVTVLPCFMNRGRCACSAPRVAIARGAAGRGVVLKVHSKCTDRVRWGRNTSEKDESTRRSLVATPSIIGCLENWAL